MPTNSTSKPAGRVLTLNGGSSSIKFALLEPGPPPERGLAGAVERVGLAGVFLRTAGPDRPDVRRPLPATDFDETVAALLD